ncbi:MAG: dual OB domain-containing protein [Halodesulfovibrio sp.]
MAQYRFICLAKSYKCGGYCVAGKTADDNQWIRPVSPNDEAGLTAGECQYIDRGTPEPLDIIECHLGEECPNGCQTENIIIELGQPWRKLGTFEGDITALCDDPANLWGIGDSSRYGLNDRVLVAFGEPYDNSLHFISATNVSIIVQDEGQEDELKLKCRIQFSYNNNNYRLMVTDPLIRNRYINMGAGQYNLGEAHITTSLGVPLHGYRYKLAAAVI